MEQSTVTQRCTKVVKRCADAVKWTSLRRHSFRSGQTLSPARISTYKDNLSCLFIFRYGSYHNTPETCMDHEYASWLWMAGYILSRNHITKYFAATRVATHHPSYSAKIGETKPSLVKTCSWATFLQLCDRLHKVLKGCQQAPQWARSLWPAAPGRGKLWQPMAL